MTACRRSAHARISHCRQVLVHTSGEPLPSDIICPVRGTTTAGRARSGFRKSTGSNPVWRPSLGPCADAFAGPLGKKARARGPEGSLGRRHNTFDVSWLHGLPALSSSDLFRKKRRMRLFFYLFFQAGARLWRKELSPSAASSVSQVLMPSSTAFCMACSHLGESAA